MKLELAAHQIGNLKSYDIGDVIDVVEDGQLLGKQISKAEWIDAGEKPGDFELKKKPLIINLSGVPVAKLESFLEADIVVEKEGDESSGKKRLLSIDYVGLWAILPQSKKNRITNEREITITKTQLRDFLKRKSNGAIISIGI